MIAQVAFSVGVLPLSAELAYGTLRTGAVGPGFAAEEFATARVALEEGRFLLNVQQRAALFGDRQRELTRRLQADPGILDVTAALRPPGEEPWVFVDIEGRDAPTEALNGRLPGFPARFNQVDASFFEFYQVPTLTGRGFADGDAAAEPDAVIVNRNFADTIAPGSNALTRFRNVRAMDGESLHGPEADHWYEVVGVVGNLPVTTDARVAYHPVAPGQIHPANLQVRLRGDPAGLAERLRDVAASVDPALHVDEAPHVGRDLSRPPLRRQPWRHHHRRSHRQRTAALGRRPGTRSWRSRSRSAGVRSESVRPWAPSRAS